MNAIKVEVDEDIDLPLNDDYLNFENRCLICLQLVTQTNQELSLNFLLNYLRIRDKVKLDVCEKCEENLTKFRKLCDILEKVRLEMDYLLDFIKSSISNSNEDFTFASLEISSVREAVMKKCGEQIKCRKPQINLKRLDLSIIKTRSKTPTSDCSEDFSQQFDDSNSRLSDTSATPVIDEIKTIKMEINSGEYYSANRKTCLKCSKTFTRRKDLQRHVKAVHLRLKPINCSECPKTFSFSKDLNRHIKYVHLRHKPFKCDICDKSYSTKDSLENHKDGVHHRVEPFKCPTCHKEFNFSRNLQTHINAVHLRIKPHKCDMCDKAFIQAHDLRRHKLLPHPKKTKKFLCKICNKNYSNIKSLNKHQQYIHSKIFPKFECDVCKKIFQTCSNLKRHFSAVHEKRRHHCQAEGCKRNYSTSEQLLIHYRMEHPGFEIPPEPPEEANLTIKDEEKTF